MPDVVRQYLDLNEKQIAAIKAGVRVYGLIPGGQRVRDGTYSDVITVTVFF